MKQVQKRYLYSSLLSSFFFIICYGVLDLNVLIILILTIVMFISGILLFKEKDIRQYDPKIVMNYYFLISRINNFKYGIDNEEIKKVIESLSSNTERILSALEQRQRKVEQVYDFFDYYLEIAFKILKQYEFLQNKKDLTDSEKQFVSKAIGYLKSIENLFKKQLKNMWESKMIDVNTEIKLFEKTINSDINMRGVNNG